MSKTSLFLFRCLCLFVGGFALGFNFVSLAYNVVDPPSWIYTHGSLGLLFCFLENALYGVGIILSINLLWKASRL